jgi:hypothetical protein
VTNVQLNKIFGPTSQAAVRGRSPPPLPPATYPRVNVLVNKVELNQVCLPTFQFSPDNIPVIIIFIQLWLTLINLNNCSFVKIKISSCSLHLEIIALVNATETTSYFVFSIYFKFPSSRCVISVFLAHPVVPVPVSFLLSLPDKYTHQNICLIRQILLCKTVMAMCDWWNTDNHTHRAVNRIYNQSSTRRRIDVNFTSRLRDFALHLKTINTPFLLLDL